MTREEFIALEPIAAAEALWPLVEESDQPWLVCRALEGKTSRRPDPNEFSGCRVRGSVRRRLSLLGPHSVAGWIEAIINLHPAHEAIVAEISAIRERQTSQTFEAIIADLERL